jgi:hypothetical protein
MASLADLPGVAEQLLQDFAAQLTEQGVTLPPRQYRTPGAMVPWDGEQFTVSLIGIDQGQPGGQVTVTVVPQALALYAQFSLNLVRKVAILNVESFAASQVPSAAALDSSGEQLISDAQQLILAASQLHLRYQVTGPGEGFVIGPLQPVGPEGGLAGSRLLVGLSLS